MKSKILIIDYDQQVIQSLERLIEQEKYEIYSTTNSTEAIAIIKSKDIDLIICEQYMSQLTGIELLGQAKAINPNIVRILMSGYSDINLIILGVNQKIISYYIEKPWQDDELINIVEEGLEYKAIVEANEEIITAYHKAYEEEESLESKDENANMRQFFRNELFTPICADMTIVEIRKKRVSTSSSKVCIVNIGPGGDQVLIWARF